MYHKVVGSAGSHRLKFIYKLWTSSFVGAKSGDGIAPQSRYLITSKYFTSSKTSVVYISIFRAA